MKAAVRVVVAPRAATAQGDRSLLARIVAEELGCSAEIGRLCARCGGSDHGRPFVVGRDDVFVSLSRAEQFVAVAVSRAGPVGVDIESLDRVAAAGFDDVVFGAAERAAIAASPSPHVQRARLWAAKESWLKAVGTGLRTDPSELTIGDAGRGEADDLAVIAWPASAIAGAGAGAGNSSGSGAAAPRTTAHSAEGQTFDLRRAGEGRNVAPPHGERGASGNSGSGSTRSRLVVFATPPGIVGVYAVLGARSSGTDAL